MSASVSSATTVTYWAKGSFVTDGPISREGNKNFAQLIQAYLRRGYKIEKVTVTTTRVAEDVTAEVAADIEEVAA